MDNPLKIIYIDDSPEECYLMRELCDDIDVAGHDGIDAKAFLKRNKDADLVFIDCNLGGIDAIDVINQMPVELLKKTVLCSNLNVEYQLGFKTISRKLNLLGYTTKPITRAKVESFYERRVAEHQNGADGRDSKAHKFFSGRAENRCEAGAC